MRMRWPTRQEKRGRRCRVCCRHLLGSNRPRWSMGAAERWRAFSAAFFTATTQSSIRYLRCCRAFFWSAPKTGRQARGFRQMSVTCSKNSGPQRPGGASLLARLIELLFVEVLRRSMENLSDNQIGWLAALRDPLVSKALQLIHADPTHPWQVTELGRRVGLSRSVLAERFRHFLGEPPMHYLIRWRLQLAAQLLRDTDDGISAIAARVGYDSEAAFSRAFKRQAGESPAAWRTGARAARADPGVGLRIDDPKHRSTRKISRAEIIIAVAPIEPDLVAGADLANHRHDSSVGRTHDDRMGIVPAETATHQNLVPRPHVNSVRTAPSALLHRNWERIGDLVGQRIDDRNFASRVGHTGRHRLQESACLAIPQGLLEAVGRVREVETRLEDLVRSGVDEAEVRRMLLIVRYHQDVIPWIVRHLVRAGRAAGVDDVHDLH